MSEPDLYSRSSVGSRIAISGAWLASTPIEPVVVRVETISTSSSKTFPSGVRTSTGNLLRAIALARLGGGGAGLGRRALGRLALGRLVRAASLLAAAAARCLHDF